MVFAGIVEGRGQVTAVAGGASDAGFGGAGGRLEVRAEGVLDDLSPGASVAINGVCLTVAERRGPTAAFDIVPETWRSTTLQALRVGDAVNVERSLRVGDRIDGHFVQGHVDGIGCVERVERRGGEWRLGIAAPAPLRPYLVRKGSVAVDGVSLTIADVAQEVFSVALIPTTRARTVLGSRRAGDAVNIETDILARLVVSALGALVAGGKLASLSGGISFDSLREGGYL